MLTAGVKCIYNYKNEYNIWFKLLEIVLTDQKTKYLADFAKYIYGNT